MSETTPSKAQFDQTILNDVAVDLQKAFNTGELKYIEKIITALSNMRPAGNTVVQRADRVVLPTYGDQFLKTGIQWLDEYLGGGLRRQELVIIGGAPHQGKTHILSFLAAAYLKSNKKLKVLHFNGEDLLGDIMDIYGNALNEEEQMTRLFLADVIESKFDVPTVDRAVANTPVDIVVIDHLDIMHAGGDAGADWLAVSEIARGLRFIAKKHNIIMLVGSQLNFIDESAEVPKFGMARFFRAKVGKASHADVILLMGKTTRDEIEMELAKARGRRIKNKHMLWQYDFNTMEIKGTWL
jgi:replicative DNA helicase